MRVGPGEFWSKGTKLIARPVNMSISWTKAAVPPAGSFLRRQYRWRPNNPRKPAGGNLNPRPELRRPKNVLAVELLYEEQGQYESGRRGKGNHYETAKTVVNWPSWAANRMRKSVCSVLPRQRGNVI